MLYIIIIAESSYFSTYNCIYKDNYVITLHILVNIVICITCVEFGVCIFSIAQDTYVCVHRSAIIRIHCRIVLRDVGILIMLHSVRCSRWKMYNILARNGHITTKFGDVMHRYSLFMLAKLCSFWSETNN
jgi:hypothetical protein